MEWRSPSSPSHKKESISKAKNQSKLVTFFDNQGIIQEEFVPPGQTENKKYYVEFLSRLIQIIRGENLSFRKEKAGFSCMKMRDLTMQYQYSRVWRNSGFQNYITPHILFIILIPQYNL
jgi:hypothetical protein